MTLVNFLQLTHTIAPVMLVVLTIVLVWFLYVSRNWKNDTERWNRKY